MTAASRLSLFLFFSLCFSSCSGIGLKSPGQKKFGPDANYFIALKLLQAGNEKEAAQKFSACAKKGSFYCAQKSARELCKLGSVQERNAACLKLIQKFPESPNLLIAARQFYSADEINKVIEITENLDFTEVPNELIKIRLEAMKKRGDSRYRQELFDWFSLRSLSKLHLEYYKENLEIDFEKAIYGIEDNPLSNDDIDSLFDDAADAGIANNASEAADGLQSEVLPSLSPEDLAINYRILLYQRNYTPAFETAHYLLDFIKEGSLPVKPQLFSDIGKAFLYGSQDFLTNANFFRASAKNYAGSEAEYYFWFYAGRLFEKTHRYKTLEKNCFLSAVQSARSAAQKDNALWYLLNSDFQNFTNETISSINKYCREWSDPAYFDDIFSNLVPVLFAAGKFNEFGSLYRNLDGLASPQITGQFAYIYARLCEQGYASATEEEIKAAYLTAIKNGNHIYYKILAAKKLGYNLEQIKKVIFNYSEKYGGINLSAGFKPDTAAENLLEGYVKFGFPEQVYPAYMELYKKGISAESSFHIADFLNKCGEENNDYYVQSIRIASRAALLSERDLSSEEMKLLYPQGFSTSVENWCQTYNVEPAVMYALIRSESFFDLDIKSHAGAVGLTQLMPATANDISRRVKKAEYDLNEPDTNIQFGTYYFSELFRRCDNSYLLSFFSYNAGITKVRRWLQSSLIEFGKKQNMPHDLFLETIPYAETQEYGRKLVSAAVLYQLLYEDSVSLINEMVE
ncbi:flagellar assembly lytic transglycosylase [Treponema sp. C6A8]|uniref:flagellar assembly lytic transglycosylase n=1 Tax=Treponema sp. C6A8 TaxID=1410609 RepID=UPI00047F88BE|nr:lytic transglycosylase domain-containing protein [Treponema sp. C6A8]